MFIASLYSNALWRNEYISFPQARLRLL